MNTVGVGVASVGVGVKSVAKGAKALMSDFNRSMQGDDTIKQGLQKAGTAHRLCDLSQRIIRAFILTIII